MKIGFTGTRKGISIEQAAQISKLVGSSPEAHHGDCVGADQDFHTIIRLEYAYVIGHLPINERYRAYCDFDEMREPKDYLDRNKDIVDETDKLLACPWEYEEQLRSGTWSTIRYAAKQNKPFLIIFRDGTLKDHI